MEASLQTRSMSVRAGLAFGGILAALYVVSAVVQFRAGVTAEIASGSAYIGSLAILNTVVVIAEIVLFFLAGFTTVRSDGPPVYRSAAKAGFIAGLVFGVVEFVTTLVIDFGFIYSSRGAGFFYGGLPSGAAQVFYGAILTLLLRLILGAALGALGGLFATPNVWQEKTSGK